MMMSAILLKIRLVTSGGLSLAEFPKGDNIEVSQLEGGMLSALIAFSKEVHHQDLKSLSFEDRTVFFIAINDFFIIIEIDLATNADLIVGVIEEIKEKAHWFLKDCSENTLSTSQAAIIVNELSVVFQRFELLHDIGDIVNDLYLSNTEIITMTIENGLLETNHPNKELVYDIYKLIENIQSENVNESIKTGIFKSQKDEFAIFIIEQSFEVNKKYGAIIVHENFDNLVCLYRTLTEQTQYISNAAPDSDIDSILESLLETAHISKFRLDQANREFISFRAYERLIDNIHAGLINIITGEPVLVIGEKILVKIIINTLLFFAQHKPIEVHEWVNRPYTRNFQLLGISEDNFQENKDEMDLKPSTVLINVNNGKVSPIKENNEYIRSLFEFAKHNKFKNSADFVKEKLDYLVNKALELTKLMRYTTIEFNEVLSNFKNQLEMSGEFELISTITRKVNPWYADRINLITGKIDNNEINF